MSPTSSLQATPTITGGVLNPSVTQTSSYSIHFCKCLVSPTWTPGSIHTCPRNWWITVLPWKYNLLTVQSELLIVLFASMLQATLTLIDPGWIYQFKSLKVHTLWHSKWDKTPHPAGASLTGDLTAPTLSCPLWQHHYYPGHGVQLQLQFKRFSLPPSDLETVEDPEDKWENPTGLWAWAATWAVQEWLPSTALLQCCGRWKPAVHTNHLVPKAGRKKEGWGKHGQDWKDESVRECDDARCLPVSEQMSSCSQLSDLRMAVMA